MKRIIYRVQLGGNDKYVALTLADYQRFVREAEEFGIASDTPIDREWLPYGDMGSLMVERVVEVNDDGSS